MMFVVFSLLVVAVGANDMCTKEYAAMKKPHTACMEDSPELKSSTPVSIADQKLIVNLHNELRRKVTLPEGVPTNLVELIWDDRLADMAQKWAKQCRFSHDKNKKIAAFPGYPGQNLSKNWPSWMVVIKSWYSEIKDFKYGVRVPFKVGHFTMLVNYRATRVGCGKAECERDTIWVCDYYEGQTDFTTPFKVGTERCGDCPDHCVNGLCAGKCIGKICQNDGSLDVSTPNCDCSCEKPYTGPLCDKLDCPTTEDITCGTRLKPSDCETYWIAMKCPLMCGPTCKGNVVEFTSKQGCKFHGVRKSAEECKKLGGDNRTCKSKGGWRTCSHCAKYSNVQEACPQTCGLCD